MEAMHTGPLMRRHPVSAQHRWLPGVLIAILFSFGAQAGRAQIGVGGVFLEMVAGARLESFAGAGLDAGTDLYTLYANPAALGFAREWHLQAAHTKWFAGLTNSSLLFERALRGTRWLPAHVAVGIAYQGLKNFNSTTADHNQADASDLLLTLAFAQRFSLFSRRFAAGMNVKYLRSRLAGFRARSLAADFGIQFKKTLFQGRNNASPLFQNGELTAGLSLANLGAALIYQAEKTPLPRALQAGLTFQTGSYAGTRLLLSCSYSRVRNFPGSLSLGSELSYRGIFRLRAGYHFNPVLIGKLTVGASIRLDRTPGAPLQMAPGRSAALQLDLASRPTNDIFGSTYIGGAAYFDTAPGGFSVIAPANNAALEVPQALLQWQPSFDADLFDAVTYRVVASRDSAALTAALENLLENGTNLAGLRFLAIDTLTTETRLIWRCPGSGDYFWSVLAMDREGHMRMARTRNGLLAKFTIPAPDLEITALTFAPSRLLTEDDEQGQFLVQIANNGKRTAENARFRLVARRQVTSDAGNCTENDAAARVLLDRTFPAFPADSTASVTVPWRTSLPGPYTITARIDMPDSLLEKEKANNRARLDVYTIPKGHLTAADTAVIRIISTLIFDVPLLSRVHFEANSAEIDPAYLQRGPLHPSLVELAERLAAQPAVRIKIQGVIDPNSGETAPALADQRAARVKAALVNLGVREEQIVLLAGRQLQRRKLPANRVDARWVLQERRFAKIMADEQAQMLLFKPGVLADSQYADVPLDFAVKLRSAVPLRAASIRLAAGTRQDSLFLSVRHRRELVRKLAWAPARSNDASERNRPGGNLLFHLSLTDSLGRVFQTPVDSAFIMPQKEVVQQRFIWPLKFGSTRPLFSFYWDELAAILRNVLDSGDFALRLTGHACAIGPEAVNMRLSRRRARVFTDKLLRYLKKRDPVTHARILQYMKKPEGLGESQPLHVRRSARLLDIQLTNETPFERALNRRIEVVLTRIGSTGELSPAGAVRLTTRGKE